MLSDILINNGVSFLEFLVITAYMFKDRVCVCFSFASSPGYVYVMQNCTQSVLVTQHDD